MTEPERHARVYDLRPRLDARERERERERERAREREQARPALPRRIVDAAALALFAAGLAAGAWRAHWRTR